MPSPDEARNYSAHAVTRDGEPLTIRAIRPEDKQHFLDAFHSVSKETIYFRFFELKEDLTDRELAYLTDVDFIDHVALVAILGKPGNQEGAGVARYVIDRGTDPLRAEAAFAVVDKHQNKGIGTQLLYHLADVARNAGVEEFTGEVLGENLKMMEVFFHSGFDIHRNVESGVIHVSFSIKPDGGGPPRLFGAPPEPDAG
ncbi:MAG: GNAT family N-acetyltransferase [bacterium]|nr:GNAT family N-acetyltransferase [bacterium]